MKINNVLIYELNYRNLRPGHDRRPLPCTAGSPPGPLAPELAIPLELTWALALMSTSLTEMIQLHESDHSYSPATPDVTKAAVTCCPSPTPESHGVGFWGWWGWGTRERP